MNVFLERIAEASALPEKNGVLRRTFLPMMNPSLTSSRDDATILLADADRSALFQTRTQLVSAGIRSLIEEVPDASALILALSRRVRHDPSTLPLFVLMDLTMRKTSGFDALKWIRNESGLAELPVIILTAVEDDAPVLTAYQLGADGYLTKRKNLGALTYIFQQARRVRAGEISRVGAFSSIPGGKGISADDELTCTPSQLSASGSSAG